MVSPLGAQKKDQICIRSYNHAQSQQSNVKPSLTGVRIKVRKGAAKAQAKNEPEGELSIYSLARWISPNTTIIFENIIVW